MSTSIISTLIQDLEQPASHLFIPDTAEGFLNTYSNIYTKDSGVEKLERKEMVMFRPTREQVNEYLRQTGAKYVRPNELQQWLATQGQPEVANPNTGRSNVTPSLVPPAVSESINQAVDRAISSPVPSFQTQQEAARVNPPKYSWQDLIERVPSTNSRLQQTFSRRDRVMDLAGGDETFPEITFASHQTGPVGQVELMDFVRNNPNTASQKKEALAKAYQNLERTTSPGVRNAIQQTIDSLQSGIQSQEQNFFDRLLKKSPNGLTSTMDYLVPKEQQPINYPSAVRLNIAQGQQHLAPEGVKAFIGKQIPVSTPIRNLYDELADLESYGRDIRETGLSRWSSDPNTSQGFMSHSELENKLSEYGLSTKEFSRMPDHKRVDLLQEIMPDERLSANKGSSLGYRSTLVSDANASIDRAAANMSIAEAEALKSGQQIMSQYQQLNFSRSLPGSSDRYDFAPQYAAKGQSKVVYPGVEQNLFDQYEPVVTPKTTAFNQSAPDVIQTFAEDQDKALGLRTQYQNEYEQATDGLRQLHGSIKSPITNPEASISTNWTEALDKEFRGLEARRANALDSVITAERFGRGEIAESDIRTLPSASGPILSSVSPDTQRFMNSGLEPIQFDSGPRLRDEIEAMNQKQQLTRLQGMGQQGFTPTDQLQEKARALGYHDKVSNIQQFLNDRRDFLDASAGERAANKMYEIQTAKENAQDAITQARNQSFQQQSNFRARAGNPPSMGGDLRSRAAALLEAKGLRHLRM